MNEGIQFVVPVMRIGPEVRQGILGHLEGLLKKDTVVENHSLLEWLLLMKIVIGQKFGGSSMALIVYDGGVDQCEVLDQPFLLAAVIDDENGFGVKSSNAGITFFPVIIG